MNPASNPARRAVLLLATATLAGAALLRRFPPEQYSFYPACPIYTALHLQCPGCGATRALAALLHGHILESLHDNALVIALLPLLLAYATQCALRAWSGSAFRWPQPPQWTVPSALTLATLFTLARNVPLS